QRENQALLQVTASLRKVAEAVGEPPDGAAWARLKGALAGTVERLAAVDKHYLRKENQLFPFLEEHGVEGPSKVMWSIHDDIRALIKQARATIAEDDAALAVSTCLALAKMADDMVTKEDQVLHPMAVDTLSDDEWAKIRAGEADIGYAFVEGVPEWPARATGAGAGAAGAPAGAPTAASAGGAGTGGEAGGAGLLALNTGGLSLEELNLVLGTLPIDFQYVDEHDKVRFYSEGHRIFPRSPGVIGRKVQNCHPPQSVHKVQQIIDAFRAGDKDTAEFWIELQGRFLHIRYFAVRDAGGDYRGVVETVQDVTGIRALEGQRRLLDW
ncbi:MAG TPA: PAS domain-containing protein, partial [Thermoleophilia bacterium]|nr:PAS domain-containing protein [Thermoleophilia bacterium]